MNGNNEVKKLLLVVLVDIEILFKNDVYKNYSDSLKSIKKNIEKMTFAGDNSKELLEEVEPILLGGGMNESFDNENEVYLKDLPQRLEAGTPNIAGVIGLGAAVDYLEKIGMDTISIYEQKLKSYLITKLEKLPYIQIINEEADSGIVAFNVEDIFSQDVAYYLNKYNICVRAGNHCAKILKHSTGVKNTVRVSLYFYNTKEEIDSLVELLSNKEKIIKEMI